MFHHVRNRQFWLHTNPCVFVHYQCVTFIDVHEAVHPDVTLRTKVLLEARSNSDIVLVKNNIVESIDKCNDKMMTMGMCFSN